jgi:NAD(P)-dependent dehydrogenase (short-subunit alcohol dehydrogenase family)
MTPSTPSPSLPRRLPRPYPSTLPAPAPVALVTGGGRGIGRLLAQALAGTGTAVGLVARSGDELDQTVELIERAGGTAAAARADVTDAAGLARAVAGLRSRLGPEDLLVNNAGVVGPIGPLWEADPDAWWTTMDVNVRGIVLATRLVLPEMVARRRGRIVNMTSQAGVHRWPLVSAYSVSKAAVVKLSENLAHEDGPPRHQRVQRHPGLLPVGMSEDFVARAPRQRLRGAGAGLDPGRAGGRPGRPTPTRPCP